MSGAVTKLLPRGPVTLWSAASGRVPAFAKGDRTAGQRADWAAGRTLRDEESRCGLVTTVADAEWRARRRVSSSSPSRSASSTAVVAAPVQRIPAIIKADVGDWQVNEIDAATGDAVILTKQPKGRWVKMSKDVRVPIEVDPTEEFGLPHKAFEDRVVNYGTYRPLWGELPPDRPVLKLSLYRESTSMAAVLSRVAHRTQVRPTAIDFASAKEGFGAVTQLVSAVGVHHGRLLHASRHYNIHSIIFNPLGHGGANSVVTNCGGNRWRVLLRCVKGSNGEIDDALKRIASRGFINYFPVSVFSIASNAAHEIAAAAAAGNYVDACRFWLQAEAERNPLLYDTYMKYIAADSAAAAGVLELMRTDVRQYRLARRLGRFLRLLAEATRKGTVESEARDLWLSIPREERDEMLAAPAAFAWNAIASHRLIKAGLRVVPGDTVRTKQGTFERVRDEVDAAKRDVYDVVLPLPGTGDVTHCAADEGASDSFYRRLAMEHSLDPAVAAFSGRLWNAATPVYRPLLARPANLEWKCFDDPDSLAILKTDLFIRQERRPVGLGFESERIRMPSPLNVSDAFREDMNPRIHHNDSGETSVALTFDLGEGEHAMSLLREAFMLRHASFHDLLTPTAIDGIRDKLKPADDDLTTAGRA